MKQLRIKEEIGAIVKLITEAEYTFCCLQEGHEPEMQYIYYDKSKAMHMTNEEGECKVEFYSEYELFKEKLCDVLQLNDIVQGEESYFMNFPAQIVDKVLELEDIDEVIHRGYTDLEEENMLNLLCGDEENEQE